MFINIYSDYLSPPVREIFVGFSRNPVPWAPGGIFIDLLRYLAIALTTLAFVSVCFAMPSNEAMGKAGANTIYNYVLHYQVTSKPEDFVQLRSEVLHFLGSDHALRVLGLGCFAFLVCLLRSSSLVKTLTHHFVQPDWLMKLLMQETALASKPCSQDPPEGLSAG